MTSSPIAPPCAEFPLHALAYLHERLIPEQFAVESQIRHRPADAIKRSVYGQDDETHGVPGDGLEIPFFDIDGNPMLGLDGSHFKVFRIFDTRSAKQLPEGAKPVRFMVAPGSGYRPYLPFGLKPLADNNPPLLVITEGPIKGACAVAAGIACIGVCGVTLWMHPESHQPGTEITIETAVHPEIVALAAKIGRVVVLADSDAKTNDSVREAMQLFAAALRHQVPSAVVAYARCKDPTKKDKDGKEVADKKGKQGLDDWLAKEGAPSVEKFLLWHVRKELDRVTALKAGGYEAKGYNAQGFAVWSRLKGCLEILGRGDLTNASKLMSICGYDWALAAHGRETKNGVSVDWTALGGKIAADCVAKGPFNPEKVRGPGVWVHPNDKNVLIVNGFDLWRTDGAPIDRVTPEYMYPRYKDLGVSFDTQAATAFDMAFVLEALQTFTWERKSDANLMLGWICMGFVAGALHWRTHLSLTGKRGSGKSTLLSFVKALLGDAAVEADGSTSSPSGIRQFIDTAAPALLIDEGEADGIQVAQMLTFLRSASSGATAMKGTADHTGKSFAMRALGCIAGVKPPAMNGADASRFVRLTVKKRFASALIKPHALLNPLSIEARELGPHLFARVLSSWPRYLRAAAAVRAHMMTLAANSGAEDRSFDTLVPAVAMSWTVLHDDEMDTHAVEQYVSEIDLCDDFARIAESSDEDDLWSLLVTRAVQTSAAGLSQKTTIGTLIENSAKEKCRGAWSTELGTYGMKLVSLGGGKFELCVNTKAREFVCLFADTAYARADLVEALRRHPTAQPKSMTTDRIGGGNPVRFVALTLEISTPQVQSPVSPTALD